jgi:hypothetical protein
MTSTLILVLVGIPVNLTVPLTSSLYKGLICPIPTLFDFIVKSPLPY